MANMSTTWGIDKLKDLESTNFYNDSRILESGASEEILQHTDFSIVQPWMEVIDDYKEWKAASWVEDLFSVYSYCRSILDLRRGYKDIFVYGFFTLVDPADEQILAYAGRYEDRVALLAR
ncbi:hypothetical protein POJ06DRAFT_238907 [Lipomyces tetrasporus]|uniref:Uncharacterized protein n=1 Tax=Lipomyces tetrasporus TaxID=54092 RepID=A0AAD7QPP0_9ASCO|nr:uncharacterized protein POJ06DRAFT_238907 [Lipomyces tetrasporus]KAJ8098986.1 hypothetical protein POJ06DRAFT_238907 [Lipomyces tetrasporus]